MDQRNNSISSYDSSIQSIETISIPTINSKNCENDTTNLTDISNNLHNRNIHAFCQNRNRMSRGSSIDSNEETPRLHTDRNIPLGQNRSKSPFIQVETRSKILSELKIPVKIGVKKTCFTKN